MDLILLPIAIMGVFLGHKIQAHFSEATFALSCRVLLAITGIQLFLKIII
ncbi:MAG: putative membrane protein YfcA [Oleispira sp.]|jgi:uncharacterized membrane protein YfcA